MVDDEDAGLSVSRRLAVVSAVLLTLLCVLWETVLAPTGSGTLAIKAIPVACALPGLWRGRLYTFRWTSLVVWLYACEGLTRATSERGLSMALAWAEVALAVLLFVGCALQVRRHLRLARAAGVT